MNDDEGMKMTRQRRVILEELGKVRSHPSADEVYRMVRRRMPRISLGTVYRNLEMLAERGTILKLELPGTQKRFDANVNNHYHMRCLSCGCVSDIALQPIAAIEDAIRQVCDCEVVGHRIEFQCVCRKCKERGSRDGHCCSRARPRSASLAPEAGGSTRELGAGGTSGISEVARQALDELYIQYNRREFVHPDPLEFVYRYSVPEDQEMAGFVASSLAYGKVEQILRSVSFALERMGTSPRGFLASSSQESLRAAFEGFKHRFTGVEDLAALLLGAKRIAERHGSLRACFASVIEGDCETFQPALSAFVRELNAEAGALHKGLLPSPEEGSACKRLNLFLRWMVRRDEVDPGVWPDLPASKLIVPLDTHLHRIARALGLTRRNSADMRTAVEVTAAFRTIAPDDPVRYDFALTRLGIRRDEDPDEFLRRCNATEMRKRD